MIDEYLTRIDTDGFTLQAGILSSAAVTTLIAEIDSFSQDGDTSHARGSSYNGDRPATVYAMRNILITLPGAADLARSGAVRALVEPLLGPNCFAVRGILFDKVPGGN